MKGAGIFVWPRAIHEGNGKAAFIVDPSTTDKQIEALSRIFTGQLGGMPWELLGPTFEVAGLLKKTITIGGSARKSTLRIEGVGEDRASAAGLSVEFDRTNWIYYQYDWSNAA